MALINCPECGQQVSDKAAICPHCGVAIAGNPDIKALAANGVNGVNRSVAPAEKRAPGASNNQQKPKKNNSILVVAAVIAVMIVGVGFYFYNNVNNDNEQEAYENLPLNERWSYKQAVKHVWSMRWILNRRGHHAIGLTADLIELYNLDVKQVCQMTQEQINEMCLC